MNNDITMKISIENYEELIQQLEKIKQLIQDIKKEQSKCEFECPFKKKIDIHSRCEVISDSIGLVANCDKNNQNSITIDGKDLKKKLRQVMSSNTDSAN